MNVPLVEERGHDFRGESLDHLGWQMNRFGSPSVWDCDRPHVIAIWNPGVLGWDVVGWLILDSWGLFLDLSQFNMWFPGFGIR